MRRQQIGRWAASLFVGLFAFGVVVGLPHRVEAEKRSVRAVKVWVLEHIAGNGRPDNGLVTTNADEAYIVLNTRKGWREYRGGGMMAFNQPVDGAVALLRYHNPKTDDYLFTLDSQEGRRAVQYLGYQDEGRCCWVSPAAATAAGGITLYLYRAVEGSHHLLTLNEFNYDAGRRKGEGKLGYVWRAPTDGQPVPALPGPEMIAGPTNNRALPLIFFKARGKFHWVMTLNPTELDAYSSYLSKDWEQMDMQHVWAFDRPDPKLVPLYRFYQPVTKDVMYTTNLIEGQRAMATLGYIDQGRCCYISPVPRSFVIPLYRLVKGDQHMVVAGPAALNWAQTAQKAKLEGRIGWVWTDPVNNNPLPTLPLP